jgi:hypothetical protein
VVIRTSLIGLSCLACLVCGCGSSKQDPPSERDAAAADGGGGGGGGGLEDAETKADAGLVGPADCDATAPLTCPDPSPRWKDVSPIFMRRCTGCHNGTGGQWPLNQYEHVADWYGEIRAQMLACTMPPVDSGIEMPLAERQTILTWIRCGFPQ